MNYLAPLMLLLLLADAEAKSPKAKPKGKEAELIKEDIVIKSKSAGGPATKVPPPAPDSAVVKELVESLDVYQKEQKASTGQVRLESTLKRLERPFPEAPFFVFSPRLVAPRYDRWLFEVFEDKQAIWLASGAGRVSDRVEWDGTDTTGRMTARVGPSYRFRFSGRKDGEDFALESEPVRLRSLTFREFMGEQHLEVDNSLIFGPGKAVLEPTAAEYLEVLADRMRRTAVKDQPYRLFLHQKDPAGELALGRAKTLRRYFAKHLVVAAARVAVEVKRAGERGDITACVLPPEKGSSIRTD